MSMIMNHDMTAIMGQRILQRNSLAMKRSLEKLSSGLRTKIADVDNTAGLAISETMLSRIGGMEKALNNSQDGISMIQTASGALEQTQSMLMRMRELSVQAANDVLTQQDRSYIQVEINEIRDEISNQHAVQPQKYPQRGQRSNLEQLERQGQGRHQRRLALNRQLRPEVCGRRQLQDKCTG